MKTEGNNKNSDLLSNLDTDANNRYNLKKSI